MKEVVLHPVLPLAPRQAAECLNMDDHSPNTNIIYLVVWMKQLIQNVGVLASMNWWPPNPSNHGNEI